MSAKAASAFASTNNNENTQALIDGDNGDGGPMTPLRTLNDCMNNAFSSPRWAQSYVDQERAQALARGEPVDIPHTMVNPALASASAPSNLNRNQVKRNHTASPLSNRLLPPSWLKRTQLHPQPQPPPPYHPALVQQPASSSTATAQPKQAPVLHLHRRRDNALPVPPVRIRPSQGTAGQANDYQPDSPPSPPIPPTVRPFAFGKTASVSASAAGKGTASRTLHRRAPALAAAAEPPAPETPHRDWDEDLDEDEADDSDDEQQATIRPPKHHTRPSPAASRRILVSTATSMTPYQQPAWHNHPDIHRAPTPILDNQGDADHTNIHSNSRSDRVTRSRARQLQQESVGSAVLSRMQPMIDALNSFASVTVSGVLSLLSVFISRPIRWLSNRTNPLFTFSFLFILVLLILSWALEPSADPLPTPTPPPPPTVSEIETLTHRLADMDQAVMQLVYQQDALEAADAALAVQLREELSTTVAQVASERAALAVDASVTRAVDQVVTSVLDQVHELTLVVSEVATDVANLTLRMDHSDPDSSSSTPAPVPSSDSDTTDSNPDSLGEPQAPLINYASFTTGARALPASSSPTHKFTMHPSAVIGGWLPASVIPWFLRPGVPAHGHNWALHPDMQRGSCWATPMGAGGRAPAKLTIRLARPVTPRAVAVWHHERGGLEAPRDVGVYGRRVRDGEWYLLARGEYVRQGGEGSAVGQRQVFEVQQGVHEEVDHVRFVVEKNWGAREYTCLYRVEVLAPAPAEEAAVVAGGSDRDETNDKGE